MRTNQTPQVIALRGGLDLVTPAMEIPPGMAISAANYEVEARGYRRLAGYERTDGRLRPSDAKYLTVPFTAGSAALLEDQTVTGASSGASGAVVVDAVALIGDFGAGTAEGLVHLHGVTGTFQTGEALRVGGVDVALIEAAPLENGSPEDGENETLIAVVRDKRRAAIQKPAGSGPIRGIATLNGATYCWRDNAAGTAGQMFRATPTGWVLQTPGRLLEFSAGTAQFLEGETVTGGTSGATGTIERVALRSGAWDASGEGFLVLSGVSGAFASGETVTSTSGSATAPSADAAITLPPGGKYRALSENFYGTASFQRLYFANGVGPAMEWDGAVLAPVLTGLPSALEKPKYIAVHRLHLFLGYDGGSVQFSSPGTPLVFNGTTGAGELGLGQDLTGMKSNTRDSLIITGRNKIGYLIGSDFTSFELKSVSEDSGAVADTLEIVGSPIFLDDQGVRDMQAAETFGDWQVGTKTQKVEPLLRQKRDAGEYPIGALRVRAKDQYRLFYTDGSGFIIYFGREFPEIMTFALPFSPTCLTSGEGANGYEVLLAGGEDGFVYELDRGTSFDGEVIQAFLRLSFVHQGLPNWEKRYHRIRLEGQAAKGNSAVAMTADFSYGNTESGGSTEKDFSFFGGDGAFSFYGGGGFWNEAAWDEFVWSSQLEGQAFAALDGIGENVSIVFMSDSAVEEPHTLSALTINYSKRRRLR